MKQTAKTGAGRLFGYARVSTQEQKTDLQIDDLLAAGVPKDRIYRENVSAVAKRRPQLALVLAKLGPGDVLVVWKLDRLARSLSDLLAKVEQVHSRGAKIKFLKDPIDTTTPSGTLIMHIMAALAQFERELTIARTKAGIEARRLRGGQVGRKRQVDVDRAERLIREGQTIVDVAADQDVSDKAIRRYFNRDDIARLRREGPKKKR